MPSTLAEWKVTTIITMLWSIKDTSRTTQPKGDSSPWGMKLPSVSWRTGGARVNGGGVPGVGSQAPHSSCHWVSSRGVRAWLTRNLPSPCDGRSRALFCLVPTLSKFFSMRQTENF